VRPLVFVIHDMNLWSGQERCTLEVARRLSYRWPVEVVAYSLEDPALDSRWGALKFHRIRPNLRHPMILRSALFHGATLARLLGARLGRKERPLIHAAGACSLVADVVQVHFVQAAWRARKASLPLDVVRPPRAGAEHGLATRALEAYHDALLAYHCAIEARVFTPDKTYLAISRQVARELEEHFGLGEQVSVVHHGVDSEVFHPVDASTAEHRHALRRSLGVPDDRFVAGFVGVFERKGLGTAIDALAALSPAVLSRIHLVAVGAGNQTRFRERAERLGLGERVTLVGPKHGIESYFRLFDAFVFPTLYEPFGLAVLEAMATGIPVLVSALAGASELVEDGETGILLRNPLDPRELARGLERLVLEPELASQIGAGARRVAETHSWDRVARRYEEILAPIMEKT